MNVPKQQIYQMWTSSGSYLGILQGVTSKYKRIQDINTIGSSSINISVSMKLDTPMMPTKAITTEDNLWVTTESGVGLTTEGELPNYGNVDKSKIRNGNIVQITEVADSHPNGIIVFKGKVKKWKVNFGTTDDATLTVIPLSDDMNNHLVRSGATLGTSQTNISGGGIIMYNDLTGVRVLYNYDFKTAGMSNIASVSVWLGNINPGTTNVTARIIDLGTSLTGTYFTRADDPNNTVATSLPTAVSSTTQAEYSIAFSTPYYFDPAHYYGVLFTSSASSSVGCAIYYSGSDVTALGAMFYNDPGAGGWNFGLSDRDIYFKFYSVPPYTKVTITNFEPSTFLKTMIDNYNGEGGVVTYTPTSIQSTGINIATYTFQTNTVAEGLDTLLNLSPQGFYYTIDPGTNVLTFKRVNTTADHVLVFRRHIQNLDLSASIEKLANSVYFAGGLSGGTNVYVNRPNPTSIASFGVQIDRISDVNVTDGSVAAAVAANYLDKEDDEIYETDVQIIDGQTDITSYKLGETIGFQNFGTFADSVIIPIVRLSRDMEVADLSLGSLPVRQSDYIQSSQQDILALQNVANPTQPS